MNKRGIETQTIVRLFFIAAIIILSLGAMIKIQDDTLFTEQKAIKDMSLMHDAALGSPHPLTINYEVPELYHASEEGAQFKILRTDKPELTPLTYPHAQSTERQEVFFMEENGRQELQIKHV